MDSLMGQEPRPTLSLGEGRRGKTEADFLENFGFRNGNVTSLPVTAWCFCIPQFYVLCGPTASTSQVRQFHTTPACPASTLPSMFIVLQQSPCCPAVRLWAGQTLVPLTEPDPEIAFPEGSTPSLGAEPHPHPQPSSNRAVNTTIVPCGYSCL